VRRSIAAGIWLALTVTATLIVWAAVSVVAADVTDRPAPVVAHRDVVVALQAGSGETTTTDTTTTAVPRAAPAATTVAPRVATATTTPERTVVTIAPPVGQATTTTAPRATTTTTKPPVHPPTTPPFAGGTATYSTAGGVVAVGCTGPSSIRLIAALPADGYQALVTPGGTLFVQVNFVSPARTVSVSAVCFFGQPFESEKTTTPPPGR
jgi:hypothetical protein